MAENYTASGVTYDRPQNDYSVNPYPVTGGLDSSGQIASFGTTADKLINPPKVARLRPTLTTTSPYDFVNGLQPAINQANDGLIRANTQEEAARTDVLNRLLGVQDPNAQGAYNTKFKNLDGNDYLKQFTDANTRLAQLTGVFNTGMQKISSAPGQSQVFEGLQLNEANRQKAVEVGNQAILVQALQGNIATARQIALDTSNFATQDRAAKLQSLGQQFDALNGIVTGQEKQLIDRANIQIQQELDQLKRAQTYVDSAIQSGEATPEEMQRLTDPKLTDFDKQQIAAGIISRSGAAKNAFERNKGRYDLKQTGVDEWGNPIYSVFDSTSGAIKDVGITPDGTPDFTSVIDSSSPDGTKGGQCAVYAENICDFGTPGNRLGYDLKAKQQTVDKYGIKASDWRNSPQVGDGIIFNLGKYGHVSVVTAVNGDGTVTVKDSNYGLDEKVQTRNVSINDPSIYGALRGTLKGIQQVSETNDGASTNDYLNALRSAAIGLPAAAKKDVLGQLQQYVKSGDSASAKDLITRTAIASAPVEQQNQAQGRMEALSALDTIKSKLDEYVAAGGNTNIFTGTEEQIANKVGATKDPKLAYLANQINQAFINYRRSMTGVAFSPQESAQYEKLFPSIGKVGNFNQAVIQSLQDTMNRNQALFLKVRIGATNYSKLFGDGTSDTTDNSPESDYIQKLLLGTTSSQQPSQSATMPSLRDAYNIIPQPVKDAASNTLGILNPIAGAVSQSYNYIKSLFR